MFYILCKLCKKAIYEYDFFYINFIFASNNKRQFNMDFMQSFLINKNDFDYITRIFLIYFRKQNLSNR